MRWVEAQTQPIDAILLAGGFSWEQRDAASDALFDFLLLYMSDDAQQLDELQEGENGPKA